MEKSISRRIIYRFGGIIRLLAPTLAALLILAYPLNASLNNRREQMSDEELLETVQRQTFRYFWDYAYPGTGMARERSGDAGNRFYLESFDSTWLSPDNWNSGEKGLYGEYYNNMYLRGRPALRRIDETIDMNWRRGRPDPRINSDSFSVRWTGYVTFPEDGEYEIGLGSDDGSRLYFDRVLLIDNWEDQSYRIKSAKVRVRAGHPYPVRLEYYDNLLDASVRLGLIRARDEGAVIGDDPDNNIVTTGGTGMGIMAIIVGVERGWITRQEAVLRLLKLIAFLERSDRFNGAFPHWLDGETGKTVKFSDTDDGADIVETSLLFQGLLTARAYFTSENEDEREIRDRITKLWDEVNWNYFTRGENILFWHWSPNHKWGIEHRIAGWDECLITYVLAASSERYAIHPEVYHQGFARSGEHRNGRMFYGLELPLGPDYGGPLFWAHYSFLGLDPRELRDQYADYWKQNVNHTLINRAHCVNNPNNFRGYGTESWGLTASDNHEGYSAHYPNNDLGVITPTAALGSMPYTPEYSMEALRHFYYNLGDRLWSRFGFIDAFSEEHNWYAESHLAIDQGPIIIMIENHRTGLLWDLFMSIPEIQEGLRRLGFEGDF